MRRRKTGKPADFRAAVDATLRAVLGFGMAPTRAELINEWRKRRFACAEAILDAAHRGDLATFREAKAQWARFYSRRNW